MTTKKLKEWGADFRVIFAGWLITSLFAFCYMVYILFNTLVFGEIVRGYPTIMVVMLFLGGAQLLALGVIGEYLGRIFHESKHRPVYIVSEVQTDEKE